MARLQTKLKSLLTSLSNPNDRPALYRTDSASSFASDTSCDTPSPDTELQPWRYERRGSHEQDEVRRKRRELAEKRRRASDAAWREFWG
jgi:hypothetical protein